jgi:hypothetical protein
MCKDVLFTPGSRTMSKTRNNSARISEILEGGVQGGTLVCLIAKSTMSRKCRVGRDKLQRPSRIRSCHEIYSKAITGFHSETRDQIDILSSK